MCFHCWSKVPAKLKAAVYRTYREGQCNDMRPSAAWHRAADAAIRSVCPSYKGVPERLLKRIEAREQPKGIIRKPLMAKIWRGKL